MDIYIKVRKKLTCFYLNGLYNYVSQLLSKQPTEPQLKSNKQAFIHKPEIKTFPNQYNSSFNLLHTSLKH